MRWPLILSLALVTGCGGQAPSQSAAVSRIVVFVAASTKEPVDEIVRAFERETGIAVTVSPGPSSGLAKQIEQGADADLFLSADQATADFLASKGLVAQRRNLLRNRLVVITPRENAPAIRTLADLADDRIQRLAVANPAVPAGEYAREALAKAGVWDRVKGKTVGGVDVRATFQYVALGEAEAGIVYYTDAADSSKVRIAMTIPAELHKPIEYPLVLIKRQSSQAAAERFFDYLHSENSAAVFRRHRFETAR
jgi:molybdate transport system substrate-binding protein